MILVITEYKSKKRGKPGEICISECDSIEKARSFRDEHMREYGDEIESIILAQKIE